MAGTGCIAASSSPTLLLHTPCAISRCSSAALPFSRSLYTATVNVNFEGIHLVKNAGRIGKLISIQRCDRDGDNRMRVCHSACESYNSPCGARLDCSDRTLFSGGDDGHSTCTGDGAVRSHWQFHF